MSNHHLKKWEMILDTLEERYPHVIKCMTDWYPGGRNEIVIKLSNGVDLIFNYLDNTLRNAYNAEDTTCSDEEKWRNEFSNRLCGRMRVLGISQWELARTTGISEVSISRYMNGRATPSGYNLDRISRALNCSSSELIDIV